MSEQESNSCSQGRNLTSNLNQLGAVGLGGLNEWWKIDFLGTKVHILDVLSSWWCVLLLKRKRGQDCPTRKVIEEEEVSRAFIAFYVALESHPSRMGKVIPFGRKYATKPPRSNYFRRQTKIRNSFCCNGTKHPSLILNSYSSLYMV